MREGSRLGVGIAIVVLLLVAIGVVMRRVNADRARSSAALATATTSTTLAASNARRTPHWPVDPDEGPSEDQAYKSDPTDPLSDTAAGWARVDLDEVRRALPNSLYWKMASPTKDPAVIEERERIRAEWNVQYGKVLSNTATDQEIDAYYAEQQKLSEDYLELLVYLADHYAEAIPRSEVGALKLAGELHLARLEEIPRRIAEAKERHAAHEKAREAWLEEQKQFAPTPPAAP